MKKTALLFVFTCLTIFPLVAEVEFIQGDLKKAKARAAREGKLILLDFWASYCTPCKMMEEYTFTDPEVEAYINAHYVPVKVDIQSFDGFDLKAQFKVSLLPTIIVLNSKGVQVGRHEETFSASRLIPMLETYNKSHNRQKYAYSNSDLAVNDINKPTKSNNSTMVMNVSKTNTAVRNSSGTPPPKTTPTNYTTVVPPKTEKVIKNETTTPSPPKAMPAKLALDGVVAADAAPNTFSIQVCAYFAENQLKEAMEDIKKQYGKKGRIFVAKRWESGKNVFRVLVGHFNSKQSAEKFMKTNNIKGIVKDLNSLK